MATNTAPIEPLVIAGIRDHVTEPRHVPRGSALLVLVAALAVAGAGVAAAVLDTTVEVGPGRVLCAVLIVLWCVAAAFVSAQRADEPLAWIMVAGAAAGAAAVLGQVLLGRDLASGARDVAAAVRALGLALLPSVVLHLGLAVPDGRLRSSGQRFLAAAGYLTSLAKCFLQTGNTICNCR